jgi:Serine carboxypeptidase S28
MASHRAGELMRLGPNTCSERGRHGPTQCDVEHRDQDWDVVVNESTECAVCCGVPQSQKPTQQKVKTTREKRRLRGNAPRMSGVKHPHISLEHRFVPDFSLSTLPELPFSLSVSLSLSLSLSVLPSFTHSISPPHNSKAHTHTHTLSLSLSLAARCVNGVMSAMKYLCGVATAALLLLCLLQCSEAAGLDHLPEGVRSVLAVKRQSHTHTFNSIREELRSQNLVRRDVEDTCVVETHMVTQRVDHFNVLDRRTYKQRVHINKQFYRQGGPVFVYIGGEGPEENTTACSGFWYERAQDHHAVGFALLVLVFLCVSSWFVFSPLLMLCCSVFFSLSSLCVRSLSLSSMCVLSLFSLCVLSSLFSLSLSLSLSLSPCYWCS